MAAYHVLLTLRRVGQQMDDLVSYSGSSARDQ
jgi:hypothetical protein